MSSSTPTIPAVVRSVTVNATLEHAFRTFTAGFGSWWPRAHHIGKAELAEAVLEQRLGGRWYERGTDGSECDWGTVLTWEPPHRLVVSWQIDHDWEYDPDPAHASEVEVRFTADGPGRTTVSLEHRDFDRMPQADDVARSVAGSGGWAQVLDHFAQAAQAA